MPTDNFILFVYPTDTPNSKDVHEHIHRLKVAHQHFKTNQQNKKNIIGAIAGIVFSKDIKQMIIENGLYVIKAKRNKFIIDVPENFQPKYFVGEKE